MMVVVVGDGHYCFVVFVSSGVSVVVIVDAFVVVFDDSEIG